MKILWILAFDWRYAPILATQVEPCKSINQTTGMEPSKKSMILNPYFIFFYLKYIVFYAFPFAYKRERHGRMWQRAYRVNLQRDRTTLLLIKLSFHCIIYSFIYLFVQLFINFFISLFLYFFISLLLYFFISLFIYLFLSLFIYEFISLLFIYLFI